MQTVKLNAFFSVILSFASAISGQQVVDGCNPSESYQVVIVGAGISGLTAAVELYTKLGVKNVTILEGRNRLGGRIFTERSPVDKTYVDIGAQFVHGERGNAAYKFAKEHNLIVPKLEKPRGDDAWYNLKGEELSYAIVNSASDAYDDARNSVRPSVTTSIGDQMKSYFSAWLRRNSAAAETKQALFDFYYNDECTETSEDLSKVGTEEDTEYEDASGDQAGLVRNGWSSVVERLVESIPVKSMVQLGANVSQINWDVSCSGRRGKQVAIYLADGRVISGKKAIVTLPLGVLKSNSVKFVPQLPSSKKTAIDGIGFGCTGKIFLFFKKAWWGKNSEVNALFIDGVPAEITVTPSYYANKTEQTWYRHMVAFNTVYGNNLVLQAWVTGDWARIVERLPLDEVTTVVNQILDKAFGKDFRVQHPYRVLKSSWCGDPFTRGAYSYVQMGRRAIDYETMAEPLPEGNSDDKLLFFAGEHTSEEQWASVHGAWTSGIRAAKQLADEL